VKSATKTDIKSSLVGMSDNYRVSTLFSLGAISTTIIANKLSGLMSSQVTSSIMDEHENALSKMDDLIYSTVLSSRYYFTAPAVEYLFGLDNQQMAKLCEQYIEIFDNKNGFFFLDKGRSKLAKLHLIHQEIINLCQYYGPGLVNPSQEAEASYFLDMMSNFTIGFINLVEYIPISQLKDPLFFFSYYTSYFPDVLLKIIPYNLNLILTPMKSVGNYLHFQEDLQTNMTDLQIDMTDLIKNTHINIENIASRFLKILDKKELNKLIYSTVLSSRYYLTAPAVEYLFGLDNQQMEKLCVQYIEIFDKKRGEFLPDKVHVALAMLDLINDEMINICQYYQYNSRMEKVISAHRPLLEEIALYSPSFSSSVSKFISHTEDLFLQKTDYNSMAKSIKIVYDILYKAYSLEVNKTNLLEDIKPDIKEIASRFLEKVDQKDIESLMNIIEKNKDNVTAIFKDFMYGMINRFKHNNDQRTEYITYFSYAVALLTLALSFKEKYSSIEGSFVKSVTDSKEISHNSK
jgi:hypothetical protein